MSVFDARVESMRGPKKDGVKLDPKAERAALIEAMLDGDAQLRGHMSDRLDGIDEDIAGLKVQRYREDYPLMTLRERRKSVAKQLASRRETLLKRFETAPPGTLTNPGTSFREDPAILRAQLQKQIERSRGPATKTWKRRSSAMAKEVTKAPAVARRIRATRPTKSSEKR